MSPCCLLLVLTSAVPDAPFRYQVDFTTGARPGSLLKTAPDQAAEGITYDEAGAIFTTADGAKAVGFTSPIQLMGDFELSVRFELLENPVPKQNGLAGLALRVESVGARSLQAALAWGVMTDGKPRVVAALTTANSNPTSQEGFPESVQGALRLRRVGPQLIYEFAKGADWRYQEIRRVEFPTAAVGKLTIETQGGTPLRVRLAKTEVRANEFKSDQPLALTSNGEWLLGPILSLSDGTIEFGGENASSASLDELAQISFSHRAGLKGDWLGATGKDLARPGAKLEPNSTPDLGLRLAGLRNGVKLQQALVVCRGKPRTMIWRLDPSNSTSWALALERENDGPEAVLYLEPPTWDYNGLPFEIRLTYADGGEDALQVIAGSGKGDPAGVAPDNAVAKKASESAEPSPILSGEWRLITGETLIGHLESLDDKSAKVRPNWSETVSIPVDFIHSFISGTLVDREKRAAFNKSLHEAAGDGIVLATRDGQEMTIEGVANGFDLGRLSVLFQDEPRMPNASRVLAFGYRRQPAPRREERIERLRLVTGELLEGAWIGFHENKLRFRTGWNADVMVPVEQVATVTVRNGQVEYLSNLQPAEIDETPYFTRMLAYRRDEGLTGGPLRINGLAYAKGLAVHSRCEITYDLNGRYDRFESDLGFDDQAAGKGSVSCVVSADGESLLEINPFTANEAPRQIRLSVTGKQTLTLLVDFGEREDIGDRVIWGEARVRKVKE